MRSLSCQESGLSLHSALLPQAEVHQNVTTTTPRVSKLPSQQPITTSHPPPPCTLTSTLFRGQDKQQLAGTQPLRDHHTPGFQAGARAQPAAAAACARGAYSPGMGNELASASTSTLSACRSARLRPSTSTYSLNSLSLAGAGVLAAHSLAILTARSRNSATLTKSASLKPRVVSAGVPTRMPPGMMALLSPGTLFLFSVMDTSSSTVCTRAPSMPLGLRSTRMRWLSVPPDTMV
mmetsp:Transcript_29782/g.75858  ORF Transcript_29782/g.75858 Transcript_29782/m.75858 type:complete len:235 (+) Transcript_29782:307-1011(+)